MYILIKTAQYTFSTSVSAAGAAESYRVSNIRFPEGRTQEFVYNSAAQLKAVLDSSGYALVFDYSGNNVSHACGYNRSRKFVDSSTTCNAASLRVSYQYTSDSTPKLSSITDTIGNSKYYDYDRNEISCVKVTLSGSCRITNSYGNSLYHWQVTKQVLADGSIWQYSYTGDYTKARNPEMFAEVEPSVTTTMTDPLNRKSYYSFVQGSPYSMANAEGKVTSYRFSGGADYSTPPDYSTAFGKRLMSAQFPEGNKYTAGYGIRNAVAVETMQAKPSSSIPAISVSYGHVANCDPPYTRQNCAKPLWKLDARNNRTDYAYENWGGLKSEMQPAESSGRARPLRLVSYVQKSAYILNNAGSLVAAPYSQWMVQSEVQCQTAEAANPDPVCDASKPVLTTTFKYGADGTVDNLLVREKTVVANGTSLRTCYGYDQTGNKIWETSPNGVGSTCG